MKDLIAKESTLDEKLNAREASFDKQNHWLGRKVRVVSFLYKYDQKTQNRHDSSHGPYRVLLSVIKKIQGSCWLAIWNFNGL